jgi:hypothetical protein
MSSTSTVSKPCSLERGDRQLVGSVQFVAGFGVDLAGLPSG